MEITTEILAELAPLAGIVGMWVRFEERQKALQTGFDKLESKVTNGLSDRATRLEEGQKHIEDAQHELHEDIRRLEDHVIPTTKGTN